MYKLLLLPVVPDISGIVLRDHGCIYFYARINYFVFDHLRVGPGARTRLLLSD